MPDAAADPLMDYVDQQRIVCTRDHINGRQGCAPLCDLTLAFLRQKQKIVELENQHNDFLRGEASDERDMHDLLTKMLVDRFDSMTGEEHSPYHRVQLLADANIQVKK